MSLKAALYRLFPVLAAQRGLLHDLEWEVDASLARQQARWQAARPERVWWIVPPTGGKYRL